MGCSQEDYNGGDRAQDRQHSNGGNKDVTTRKVNPTWQQSTKMMGEHVQRRETGLVAEEITSTEMSITVPLFTFAAMLGNEGRTVAMQPPSDLGPCLYFTFVKWEAACIPKIELK